MKQAVVALALASSLGSLAAHAEMIPNSEYGSGNWSGAAYTSDQSGEFSHCVVSAPYVRGETLYFSVNANAEIVIGVQNPKWNMGVGEQIDVAIYIDNYRADFADAEVIDPTTARAILPGSIFQKIRLGHTMRISTVQGYLDFSLAGTAKAMNVTLDCAKYWVSNWRPSSGPFGANDDASVSAPAATKIALAVPREDLLTLMINVLSESGVSGYRVLKPAETPEDLKDYPVVWSLNGVVGVLTASRLQTGENAVSYSSKVIGAAADWCKGRFASGSEPAGNDDAVRMFTACQTNSGSSKTDFSLIQNQDILYVFATITTDSVQAPKAPDTEDTTESVLRNASLVVDAQ